MKKMFAILILILGAVIVFLKLRKEGEKEYFTGYYNYKREPIMSKYNVKF